MKTAIISLLCLVLVLSPLSADVPRLINYQGILTDDTGDPLDGTYDLTFKIYPDSMLGTSAYWTEIHTAVDVSGGLYNIILGSIAAIPDTLFQGEERWLGLTVDVDSEMRPLMRVTSVPWALRAAIADSLVGGGGGNTLDEAYNQGGSGAGRIINVDAGGVVLDAAANGENNPALIIQGNDLYEAGFEILNDMYSWQVHVQSNGEIGITRGKAFTPLRIVENSFNNALVLTPDGVAINTNAAVEKLHVNGAINIGDAENTNAGTIKWNGVDFFGPDGSSWKSLTSGSGGDDGDWTILGDDIYASVSGNVGIGIYPVTRLHVGTGDVLFGDDATSGGGSKFMWLDSKAALRAGYIQNTFWDTDSIGTYSVAGGYNTKAKGISSTAFGTNTRALGDYSTALGSNTSAGYMSTATGLSSNAAGDYSTAMGFNTTASGNRSTAMGDYSSSSGQSSTAMGMSTDAEGDYSTAMGFNTTASGDRSIALGDNTSASGYRSTSMGYNTNAESYLSTVIGYNNVGGGNPTSWVVTDPLFEVGNGTPANAMTILKNGNVGIGTPTPGKELDVTGTIRTTQFEMPTGASNGYLLTSDATGSASWQAASSISDGDWTVTGEDMHSSVPGKVGIGTASPVARLHVAENDTVLFGADTEGSGSKLMWLPEKSAFRAGETGVLWNDISVGSHSFATGYLTKASGYYSTALGRGTRAEARASTAIGSYNNGGGTSDAWVYEDPIFEIGIGPVLEARENAVTVLKNGKVAIGNHTPVERLDVNGGIKLGLTTTTNTGTMRFFGGDFEGYDGTGWKSLTSGSDGDWEFTGSDIYSAVAGNVGIGTATPSEKLDILGNVQVSGNVQTSGFEMSTGATDGYVLTSDATGIASWQLTSAVSDGDWTISGNDVYLSQSGGVGIGVTSPECDLQIYDAYSDVLFGSSRSGAGVKLLWKGGAGWASQGVFRAGQVTGDQWDESNSGFCSFATGRDTKASGDYSTAMGDGSEAVGEHSFAIRGGQATGDRAIALGGLAEGDNSVTIGAGSHTTVHGGGVAINGGTTTYGVFAVGGSSNAWAVGSYAIGGGAEAHQAGAISIGHDIYNRAKNGISVGNGTEPSAYAGVAVGSYNVDRSGDDLYWVDTDPIFEVGNGEDETNRSTAVTILKNGNVGIGTNSPENTFHLIHGSGFPSSGGGLRLENADSDWNWNFWVHNASADLMLYFNDVYKGHFSDIDGTWYPSSDARVKKDDEPLRDVLPSVKELEPITFRNINQSAQDKKSIGFFAQDVEKHFPEIVEHVDDQEGSEMYTLSYSKLGVIAIKAIQEQQELIKIQAEKIKELEKRISKLENN